MTIMIPEHQMEKIFKHGEDTYPEECCGVLIADIGARDTVIEARSMQNTNAGSRDTRYNIDPIKLMELEDELDEKQLTMVGIYHSHPDHPAKPSEYDRQHAWPNLSYLVMRTAEGKTEKITSWRLDDETRKFAEEEIEIIDGKSTEE